MKGQKTSYISTALTKTNDACQVATIANEFTIRACTSCLLVAYKRSSRIALARVNAARRICSAEKVASSFSRMIDGRAILVINN